MDAEEQRSADDASCDAGSDYIDENKKTKEAPLKRMIDQQHQIN